MSTVTIRPRTEADIPSCIEILHSVYAISGYPVDGPLKAQENLKTLGRAWVAVAVTEDEGTEKVLGHVALNPGNASRQSHVRIWEEQQQTQKQKQKPSKGGGGEKTEGEKEVGVGVGVLGWLFVHPDARGRGLATRLVNHAMKEKEMSRTTERAVLLALVKDVDAIRLYEKLGWTRYGTTVYKWRDPGTGVQREMEGICFVSPV
ncbi:acyl-CoA N-acyltransferase [Poronia punctata]|nr:acyl-CoA N-acyltransferase [Poronia punctata]